MSRRSARILSRRSTKRKVSINTEQLQDIRETFNRKRKPDDDCDTLRAEVTKRRKQVVGQCAWRPLSRVPSSASVSIAVTPSDAPSTSSSTYSPRHNNTTPVQRNMSPEGRGLTNTPMWVEGGTFGCPQTFDLYFPVRISPLPTMKWAQQEEVWQVMLKKEVNYDIRVPHIMERHPSLTSKMRSILLDWLNEVSEVYRLHRESFYLAIDFFDRYMAVAQSVHKGQLQLLGITCLFIAAKMEEIYPPKVSEFAYVTDGACTEEEIVQLELVVMKTLKWDLTPATPCFWLKVYLQLVNFDKQKMENFVLPQYSQHAFIQLIRLVDLCVLDVESLRFHYSILAAAALYHLSSEMIALEASGYEWSDIEECVQWMVPFAMTVRDAGQVELKFFQNILSDSTHNIQTHVISMDLLERVQQRVKDMCSTTPDSPESVRQPHGMITPPQSTNAKASSPSSSPHSSPGPVTPNSLHHPAQLHPHRAVKAVTPPPESGTKHEQSAEKEEQENNDPQVTTPPQSSPFPISPSS